MARFIDQNEIPSLVNGKIWSGFSNTVSSENGHLIGFGHVNGKHNKICIHLCFLCFRLLHKWYCDIPLQSPMMLQTPLVLEQLRYSGVLETVRIRKLGYPIRYLYTDFLRR